MKSEDVNLSLIGLFSLVGAPYALKFLWAPLLDRFKPPFLGRRRGWILVTQLVLIASILLLSMVKPAQFPAMTALVAFLVTFFSATQDLVIDAYRTDILTDEELGPGAALHIAGYRVGMIVSGAVALILADHFSWKLVYCGMAATLLIGIVGTALAPEPTSPTKPPRTLHEAVVLPMVEFFKRRSVFEVIAFLLFYKLDVVLAVALTTPFMLDMGFTKTDIGTVTKGFGLVATIVGTLAGGVLMPKLGMKRSLWVFGLIQGVSTMTFWLLARAGHDYTLMVSAIGIENFCSGMGNAAYAAFLMSICDRRYTATQYALFSSLMALTRIGGGAPTGYMVNYLGWPNFFLVCLAAMIPGLLLLTRFDKWQRTQQEPAVV
jgi:PAT family beta-lactamase induction signal transducer AmpG